MCNHTIKAWMKFLQMNAVNKMFYKTGVFILCNKLCKLFYVTNYAKNKITYHCLLV